MAKIYFDEYIDVDPEDYIEKCSEREKQELFDILIEEGFSEDQESINEEVRSESHRIFKRNLRELEDAWYQISKEDLEIISILAKKYGGL